MENKNPVHAAKAHPSIHVRKGPGPRKETKTYAMEQSSTVKVLDPALYAQGICQVLKEIPNSRKKD